MAVRLLSTSINSLFVTPAPRADGAYCLYMLACRACAHTPGRFKEIYKHEATIAHTNRLLEQYHVPRLQEDNMDSWLDDVIRTFSHLSSSKDCQPMINLSILLTAASEKPEARMTQIS